jgi:predicted RNA-binding protein with TRAM domain
VDIQELSGRGEGVARVQGLVIFVKDTKPTDHVKVKITRISSRFAEGEVVKQVEKVEEQQPQEESQPEE